MAHSERAQSNLAAVYSRVSTRQQEDGVSLGTQEEACLALATARGFTVRPEHVFQEVHTGAELYDRDVLREVRKLISSKRISLLVVYAIDRLSRNEAHLMVVLSEAEYAGVEIAFVTEPLDNSPEGGLIRFVRAYAARMEREKFRERSIRGKVATVQSGLPALGARPPYGYQWKFENRNGKQVKVGYVVDEVTAPVVRRVFDEAASGVPLRAIARKLNEEGVPSATGSASWFNSSVRYLLKHDIYHTGAQTVFKDRKHKKTNIEPVVLENVATPLVSPETRALVDRRLSANKVLAARNTSVPEEALLRNGFARCGYCGAVFSYSSRFGERQTRKVYPRYLNPCREMGCPSMSMAVTKLDNDVWTQLRDYITHPEKIEERLKKRSHEDPTAMDRDAFERRLALVERRRKNLITRVAMIDDDEIAAELLAQASLLNTEAQTLRADLERIEAARSDWQRQTELVRSAVEWAKDLSPTIDRMSYEARRALLLALDAVVWMQKDEQGNVVPVLQIEFDGVVSMMAPTPLFEGSVNSKSPSSVHSLTLSFVLSPSPSRRPRAEEWTTS